MAQSPKPAYPPTLRGSSQIYTPIANSPRKPLYSHTVPPRCGHAFTARRGEIIRISTPSGPQVCDLNLWSLTNPRERFWASRTRQLHSTHITTHDRLWSTLPYLRPMATILTDSLSTYGVDPRGGRVHDLLGTRCDPYISRIFNPGGKAYDFHCHSNLVRAVVPWGLNEGDVHDVVNLFQVTGLDERGRYWMGASPARMGDYIELVAEMDLLLAVSTCPGGDLSEWGWEMGGLRHCCRELGVEVFEVCDKEVLGGLEIWETGLVRYRGMHGMNIPKGEGEK
ncbi:meiotic chromosome segregation protein [Piedraia hortae CBS 480.64]|uniref:Meiotic chromosome segregation protein n=1 Tax=Piedraia hortae CBS 480.64 TaxID=1314780 RepID=A0A6A7C5M4_9PEZI|nr:meiotic chromosome segregation protein [Piedraia hortae CBS 480.64]